MAAVVLTFGGCGYVVPSATTATYVPSGSTTIEATTAPTPSDSAATSGLPSVDPTPPGLNPVEEHIQAALSRLGLTAEVAQKSPSDRADMLVDLGGGRILQVMTMPEIAAQPTWQVTGVRQLAGVELRSMRDPDGGLTTEWIVCNPNLVHVSGSPPETDDTLDAFTERLVPELGCR